MSPIHYESISGTWVIPEKSPDDFSYDESENEVEDF